MSTRHEINYKNRNFIIAEILACITFILNTICVLTAKELHAPWAPPWLPGFVLGYWLKTFLAVVGLSYFFKSKVFIAREKPRYVSISTLIVLWYSIPGVNLVFNFLFDILFSGIDVVREQGVTFESRIPTQIIWSIPMLIVLADLLMKVIKIIKSENKI